MKGWRLRLVPLAVVAAAIVTIVGAAQGAPPSTEPNDYDATIAPTTVETGETLTFTITKTTGPNSIGSVNITLPTGFSVDEPFEITTDPAGKTWTAALVGNVLQLRAAKSGSFPPLKNTESLTLTMVADCQPGSYALDVEARESRSFAGGAIIPGNDVSVTCYDFVCTAGPCNVDDGTTSLSTEVPPGATLGVNFNGATTDTCDGTELSAITQVQLDPLNYPQGYSATFVVPGATGSTRVCKSTDGVNFTELLSCNQSDPACISSETGSPEGRVYVIEFGLGDPNIDFG